MLVLTKTYPSPSTKYRETSCVAAINEKGEMRRIFPVPYRLLDGKQQFQKWEWINALITKATNDLRPESYRIDVDSIQRLSKLKADKAWAERIQWINSQIVCNFDVLEQRRQESGETLGFIRPSNVKLKIQKSDKPDWTPEEKQKLLRDGLFDNENVKQRVPLKKVPYDFYYEYECISKAESKVLKHKITDWEICALYWRCVRDYGDEWQTYFLKKLQGEFTKAKDLIFLMGNMKRFPMNWLIVGLLYPPKVEARQQSLLLLPPDD